MELTHDSVDYRSITATNTEIGGGAMSTAVATPLGRATRRGGTT